MQLTSVTRTQLLAVALGTSLLAGPLAAFAEVAPIKVGGGVRASFSSIDADSSDEDVTDTTVDSVRVYISGGVLDNINFTLNTEYNSFDEKLVVMDAIARFEYSDQFNIWAGRFLPPSDRANLYGPYYANNARPFIDGVQDGYPSESVGRQDGFMYWGQFDVLKVSAGVFDVTGVTTGDSDVIYAARAMVDFLEPEKGYYLNGTYYGKDILAVGVAGQAAGSDNAYSVDALFEKKLAGAGVINVEAEYAKYDGLGGYGLGVPPLVSAIAAAGGQVASSGFEKSDGYYVLGSYLFPQVIGVGKFQVLAKYGETTFDNTVFSLDGLPFATAGDVDLETFEFNVNYIIKDFNARISLFYVDQSADPDLGLDAKQYGIGIQLQL
jgi:hypothetical protein